MLKRKKKVGRPSNAYLKRRRNMRLFGLLFAVVAVTLTIVKLSDYFSEGNLFKLSGNVSWTSGGYVYTCPAGYEKNSYVQSGTTNACIKTVTAKTSTTCDSNKNKDESYAGYSYKGDTQMCEKKINSLQDKYEKATKQTYTTGAACKSANGIYQGTSASICWKCPNGKKPISKNGEYVCASQTCSTTSAQIGSTKVTIKQRSDGCYAQKPLKKYYYCGNLVNGKVSSNGKCTYTASASKSKVAHSIYCRDANTIAIGVNVKSNVTSIEGCKLESSSSSEKIYVCSIKDSYLAKLSSGSSESINLGDSCKAVIQNEKDAQSTRTSTGSTGSSTGGGSSQATTYTVTYDPNGAKGSQWSEQATYGKNYKTQDNWYKRTGYKFKGWNEKADGTGVDWTAWINKDWNWTYSKNVTLYAQWEKEQYKVTYHANGAPGEDYSEPIVYGNPYYTWENWYKRDGYIFTGWNESPDGKGVNWTSYINKAWTWTYTKNVELYAQWKKTTDANASQASSISSYGWRGGKFYEHGKVVKEAFIESAQSVGNYVYVGKDGNMSAFEGGASTDLWTWIKGTGDNKNKWWFGKTGVSDSYLKGKTYKICGYSASRRTCESYVFDPLGWCTSDITEQTTTKNTSTFAATGTTNSETQTTAEKYTITYHANGGDGKDYKETVVYGTKYKTWWNWYKRSGYTFKGWNEKKDGTGVSWTEWIDKEWTWTYKKNVDLYAQWTKGSSGSSSNNNTGSSNNNNNNNNNQQSTFTVTYHANGGTGKDYTDTVNYQENYVTWENWYKRDGYTFTGWNEKKDGTGVDWTPWINKGWIWTYKKNVDLYAQWKKSATKTSSTPSYGWYNGKFYNNGKAVKSTYVERGQQDGYYVYMNKDGNLYNTDLYTWVKGQGSNSNKWWFSQVTNGSFYPSNQKIMVCGYSKSRRKCKEFEFDSSGWCSSGNYSCNW